LDTPAWILVLFVGTVLAFIGGRLSAPATDRLKRLEEERDRSTSDLKNYQREVDEHFEQTGQLFDQLTGDYRSLYEHLASGANRLGVSDRRQALANLPEMQRLAAAYARDEASQAVIEAEPNVDSGAEQGRQAETPDEAVSNAADPEASSAAGAEGSSTVEDAATAAAETGVPPDAVAEDGEPKSVEPSRVG
jgi:uncharacterized protein